jgi:hypothetical protein
MMAVGPLRGAKGQSGEIGPLAFGGRLRHHVVEAVAVVPAHTRQSKGTRHSCFRKIANQKTVDGRYVCITKSCNVLRGIHNLRKQGASGIIVCDIELH